MSDVTSRGDESGGDQLFLGYVPDFRGREWTLAFRHDRSLGERHARRVTWTQTGKPHAILVIEVAEFASPEQATSRLKLEVSESQVDFVAASASYGSPSLIREDQPSSAYFCRANLMIRLLSTGRDPIDVRPWAEQIANDLSASRPLEVKPHLEVKLIADPRQTGGPIQVGFNLPFDRGEWSWLHVRAEHATITRAAEADRVLVFREQGKSPVLYAWVIEPGRKVYSGQLTIERS